MMKYLSDPNWWKQLGLNVGGVLTAVLAFLGVLNIHYDWFTPGSINSVVAIIIAIGALFVGSFAAVINTYLTNHSKEKAAQVAADYQAQLKAAEEAELAQFKANLAKIESQNSPTVTPSTTGPVSPAPTTTTSNK